MPDRGRDRERKRRRRHSDEDDDDSIFAGWKLGLIVGVVVVCFAMLYPTIIHPMLMSFIGECCSRKEPPPVATPQRPPVHPGMGGPGGARPGGPSRHDVHPAMRMAQQQSKGKKKKRTRYDSSDFSSDDGDVYNDRLKKKIEMKLDDQNSGKRKLRGLQERLQQTEQAMTKILEQLEAVQAAGALVEGEAPQAIEQVESKDKPEAAPLEVDAKNEQYINDLEKALRDFKILSEAYEGEKKLRRRNSQSEEDGTSSEEMNSESDTHTDEEEGEEDEEAEAKATKASDEEPDEDSEEEESPKQSKKVKKSKAEASNKAMDAAVPLESTTESKPTAKSSSKNMRRRTKKV
ncbi:unnamed protein product [Heligmosomoides polygyrus]|uniref:RIC3 domain-containing protein n=1 Tax=Heligmosomoides polygyrus TaxID=6339 RepID=A0A183GBD8_HELPZ|nr:unnamed protein product [Heligmosomoides polygyrus]